MFIGGHLIVDLLDLVVEGVHTLVDWHLVRSLVGLYEEKVFRHTLPLSMVLINIILDHHTEISVPPEQLLTLQDELVLDFKVTLHPFFTRLGEHSPTHGNHNVDED